MVDHLLDQIELWYQAGEYGRVIYHCDLYLTNPDFQPHRAFLCYAKGLSYEKSGPAWAGHAIACFRDGIDLSKKDPVMKAKLVVALGLMYLRTGDCASYEPLLAEFNRLDQKHPRIRRLSYDLWFNYGCVLDNAFRYPEAAEAFTRAVALAEELQLGEDLGKSLHNLGGVYLAMGRLAETAVIMARAEPLINDDLHGHKKLSRRAEYALAAGDLISAHQWVTAALLHPQVDDRTRADLHYTWAQTLRAGGRPNDALEVAWKGLNFAAKAVYHAGIHKLNRFVQEVSG